MIRNSFIFLENISARKEQHLWQQGITDWDAFLKTDTIQIGRASCRERV